MTGSFFYAGNVFGQESKMYDLVFQEALSFKYREKYDEAFEAFRYCTRIDPDRAEAWNELFSFYKALNRPEKAVSVMNKAYYLDKNNEWYAYKLANVYVSLKKYEDAIQLYKRIIEKNPGNEDMYLSLAELYMRVEDYDNALSEYKKIEKVIGKNETVSLSKYDIYRRMGHDKKAIAEMQALSDDNPYDLNRKFMLGNAYLDMGDYKKAKECFLKIKKDNPDNPYVSIYMADYYKAVGDSVSSEKELVKALSNPDTKFDVKMKIFRPLLVKSLQSNDTIMPSKYFKLILKEHPNEYSIRKLYVKYLLSLGKKDSARQELRTVLNLNPNQKDVWKDFLSINMELNTKYPIDKICEEALIYFPEEPLFWYYLGVGEKVKGEYDEAMDALKKGLEFNKPGKGNMLYMFYSSMGDIYVMKGDTAAALKNYELSVSENPENTLALNNYAYFLLESGGDINKAERLSRKTIDIEPDNYVYLDTFAWIFFKQGKYGLAKIYIERAIENAKNPEGVIVDHYGDILWFNGEKEKALETWKKAYKIDPSIKNLKEKAESGKYIK